MAAAAEEQAPPPPSLPSWTPTLAGGAALYRGAFGLLYPTFNSDLLGFRNALSAAPPAPHNESVKLKEVKISRTPVPGLEEKNEGEVTAEWQIKDGAPADAPVVLYVHGGAYTLGGIGLHRQSTSEIAAQGLRVISVDYRMAPEAPAPAGIADGIIVYKWLLAQGEKASNIVFSGDSAGGGLAYGMAVYLRDHQKELPMPAAIAALTPWVDMTCSGPSGNLHEEFDLCMLPIGGWLTDSAKAYSATVGIESPLVSFLLDEGKAMPPTYIITGTADRLYSEDLCLALTRAAKGDVIAFDLYDEMIHDFHLVDVAAPISQAFYKRYADFVRAAVAGKAQARMAHVTADGKEKAISVDEAKAKLKELLERGEKAAVKMDEKVKAVYHKAIGK